jgi:hypothetical protein
MMLFRHVQGEWGRRAAPEVAAMLTSATADGSPVVSAIFGDWVRFPGSYAGDSFSGGFFSEFLPRLAELGVLTSQSICYLPNIESGEVYQSATAASSSTTGSGAWSLGRLVVTPIAATAYPLYVVTASLSADDIDLKEPRSLQGLKVDFPFLHLSSP